MIHNVVQSNNILCMSFESFNELHFRPTFDAGAVRRCIAIVRVIQADCFATVNPSLKIVFTQLFVRCLAIRYQTGTDTRLTNTSL